MNLSVDDVRYTTTEDGKSILQQDDDDEPTVSSEERTQERMNVKKLQLEEAVKNHWRDDRTPGEDSI